MGQDLEGAATDDEADLLIKGRAANAFRASRYITTHMTVEHFVGKIYAVMWLCLACTVVAVGWMVTDPKVRVFILERRLLVFVISPLYVFFCILLLVFRSVFPANILLIMMLMNASWFALGITSSVYMRS
mgnify:CR=1 FL=1